MDKFNQVLGNIGFDWQVALANLVNFILIFWLLKRYAFKPVSKIINERQLKINQGLDDAKKAQEELSSADAKKKEIEVSARAEANKIVAKAQGEGSVLISQSKIKGQEEAAVILQKAHADIEKDRQKAEEELSRKTADTVIAGVEKMLSSYVTKDKNDEMVRELLSRKTA